MSDAPNVRPFMLAANPRFVRRLVLEEAERLIAAELAAAAMNDAGCCLTDEARARLDENLTRAVQGLLVELLTPDDEAP